MTRLLSTRFGALAVAALLAVAAVGIVLVYAHKYRSSVDSANGEVTVLVANRAITQYTPGSQVVDGSMFSTRQVPADAAVDGAVSNPDQLKGLVARSDIYPGEQLTTNQFVKSNTTSPTVKLTPSQRAVAFPVDAASGLVGQVQAGDRVDVVATFDVHADRCQRPALERCPADRADQDDRVRRAGAQCSGDARAAPTRAAPIRC